ncbi:hypothetical protein [Vreelandella piezotolerans]|uniref:hypothetical protein n=1 Tax=Vreelandella piezotolerans TaxID=2609667 RepID=UPI001C628ACA|nr:hypothetical protein [Halomonas piezotolerans]
MSNQVWRFSYSEDTLKYILDSGKLMFPEMNPHTSGKYNTVEKVISDMSEEALIILANFKAYENTAVVRAAGKVTGINGSDVFVTWRKVVPSLSLHPHKIGADQWVKENVFLINGPRAKQFKLELLKKKLFG